MSPAAQTTAPNVPAAAGPSRPAGEALPAGSAIERAREAARLFCRRYGFSPGQLREVDGPPLLGPLSMEREGRRVTVYRWLGNGRGAPIVQVETDERDGSTVVYGGYAHRELGPVDATEARPIMTAQMRGGAPACAFASPGLDRRALPTDTAAEGFDGWVRGEADAIRRAASEAAPPRMFVEPGSGSVHALFDGASDEEVLARCEQTVAVYLPTAPQLPLIGFGSAVHVTTPCRPCQ